MAPLLQSEFLLEEKGEVEVRGFGTRRLFALLGESLHTRP
jgi:hypothetical protein